MNPILLIAGIFLFVSGILLGRQSQSPSSRILDFAKNFQQISPTPSQTPAPTDTLTLTTTPTMTLKASPTLTSKPTPTSQTINPADSTNLSDFQYPGANIVSKSDTNITMSTADGTEIVTSWYENRIKQLGYSSRSTAKTNTNGNVENKLGGGKNNSSVSIDIKKSASQSTTTIVVEAGKTNSSDVHIKIENNQGYL